MPSSTRNLIEANTVAMVTSVAEVAAKHLVLVGMVVAFGAHFAIHAFPIVRNDKLQQFSVQAHAGGMKGRVAFGTV